MAKRGLKRKDSSTGHTGMSQDFASFDIDEEMELESPVLVKSKPTIPLFGAAAIKTEPILPSPRASGSKAHAHKDFKSKGFAVVVSRSSKDSKNIIETHTVQKAFFSLPHDASSHDMKLVKEKIKGIKDSYEANGYEVEEYEFKLPFSVAVIGGLTNGYCASLPKPLKAEPEEDKPKKKQRKL
jgi:Zn-dependent M16 (insulinase) family peptidase